jgi:predicted N-acetyltransferase YhbS
VISYDRAVPAIAAAIRPMTERDVAPAAEALLRGQWGDRRAFFDFAVRHPECEPLVAEVGGTIAGTVIATRHGSTGWIGLVFVSEDHRRAGLGSALTKAALELLERASCRTVSLVATDMGRPIYERLGFEVVGRYVGLTRPGAPTDGDDEVDDSTRAFRVSDLDAICDLDAWATGEDRSHLLRAIAREGAGIVLDAASGMPRPHRESDRIRGFSLPSGWGGWPTIAATPGNALLLLEGIRRSRGTDRALHNAVLEQNFPGRRLLGEAGWQETWRGVRMMRGEPLDWHPDAIYGQFNFALG